MFDEGGKSVLTQKVYPADIVVAENLNGCHGGLPIRLASWRHEGAILMAFVAIACLSAYME
jgi:hypothetical protein